MININKILVIDDTMEIRRLIKIRLELTGFDVIEAENGKIGFELAVETLPNLIITDYSMPIMNGLDAARFIKNHDATKNIPIIILSSFPFGKKMIDEINSIPIDSYMMKPYEYETLFEKILELIKRTQMRENETLVPIQESIFDDKRRAHRFNTFTHANIELNGINYLARIKNISKQGLSLVLPKIAEIGSTITIKFIKGASDFIGKARVVWVNKEAIDNQFLAGLEMESVAI